MQKNQQSMLNLKYLLCTTQQNPGGICPNILYSIHTCNPFATKELKTADP